mmetsp:Transcript_17133/g.48701  ORF Transcript_17133/g.48701 Transcript_17133/m.48701 type:complete len:207 (+) Transcript_17133:1538-2158(+)
MSNSCPCTPCLSKRSGNAPAWNRYPRRRSSNPPRTCRSSIRTCRLACTSPRSRRCRKPPSTCPSTCTCRFSRKRPQCRSYGKPASTSPSTCSGLSGTCPSSRSSCSLASTVSRALCNSTRPSETCRTGRMCHASRLGEHPSRTTPSKWRSSHLWHSIASLSSRRPNSTWSSSNSGRCRRMPREAPLRTTQRRPRPRSSAARRPRSR